MRGGLCASSFSFKKGAHSRRIDNHQQQWMQRVKGGIITGQEEGNVTGSSYGSFSELICALRSLFFRFFLWLGGGRRLI